ncbi:hypothetical protein [Roseivirga pacifica]|uniref:hypothetical protein n=1 Tax=Roseivirga pacifica TaxID=1267423 RepID=UPI003BA9C7FE|tara:strand:- start:125 stop:502 length:378 start_codon:yes stop_codon:yes gene_type:complete
MKTTQLSSNILNYNLSQDKVLDKIKAWIDSNSMFQDHRFIWRIGVTNAESIFAVEGQLRADYQCKHFKYWRTDSFNESVKTISKLTKYHFVFKSPLHNYIGKGQYIFVYKMPTPYKHHFYHAQHY